MAFSTLPEIVNFPGDTNHRGCLRCRLDITIINIVNGRKVVSSCRTTKNSI